jgi:XXXCH domain-containing protein
MQQEDKLTMSGTAQELATVFKDMAESLEQGRISLDTLDMAWNEINKITLSIKNKAGVMHLKMKIASDPSYTAFPPLNRQAEGIASAAPKTRPRGGYGALKKRMKKSFKNIMYALHEHAWPSAEDISSFVRDSALMVGYPGKGDEFYQVYNEAVAAFEAAVKEQDIELATQKAHLLNDLKTRCHKLYD